MPVSIVKLGLCQYQSVQTRDDSSLDLHNSPFNLSNGHSDAHFNSSDDPFISF